MVLQRTARRRLNPTAALCKCLLRCRPHSSPTSLGSHTCPGTTPCQVRHTSWRRACSVKCHVLSIFCRWQTAQVSCCMPRQLNSMHAGQPPAPHPLRALCVQYASLCCIHTGRKRAGEPPKIQPSEPNRRWFAVCRFRLFEACVSASSDPCRWCIDLDC